MSCLLLKAKNKQSFSKRFDNVVGFKKEVKTKKVKSKVSSEIGLIKTQNEITIKSEPT